MTDRRQSIRSRVYYGGLITFNARNSTMACLVRDFSSRGARVQLANSTRLPDAVDFTIAQKGLSRLARIVWRRGDEAGLSYRDWKPKRPSPPLDWESRLRAGERARRELRRRIEQLRAE